MLPIRDTISSKNYPIVNNSIIGICIVLFLVELAQGDGLNRFIYTYGLVPAKFTIPAISSYFTIKQQLISLFSFMFLHGGYMHIISNMLFLYIFGDNVEDRLGHVRYLAFYLLCGLASGLSHLILNLHSQTPTIGASGAIAGVMGAYFILYPRSKVLTLIPIIIIPYFIELPAFIFLGVWFLMQILNAAGSSGSAGGIAWWAHIGGFISGMIFLRLFISLPKTGISQIVSSATTRKKSHKLQVIHPVSSENDPHLHGTLYITPHEAFIGTKKLVNIPWGFYKRLINVIVPAGITEGKTLKLKGLGKQIENGQQGDLLLKVVII